jgi:hypothetical protein
MIVVLMMVIAQSAHAQDTCIDPSTLTSKTVSITRRFTDDEKPRPSLEGYGATAWFYGSTRYLVSIAHFVDDAPVLLRGEWRKVNVQQQDVRVEVNARLLTVIKALPGGWRSLNYKNRFLMRRLSNFARSRFQEMSQYSVLLMSMVSALRRGGSLKLWVVATFLAAIHSARCHRDQPFSRCGH